MKRRMFAAVLAAALVISVGYCSRQGGATVSGQLSRNGVLLHSAIKDLSIGTPEVTFRVADYGAAGDGVTDDAAAFRRAYDDFEAAGENAVLLLENKTYYFENTSYLKYAIKASGMKNSAIIGNGATVLIGGSMKSMSVSGCENFYVEGLHFDRKLRSHFVGQVLLIDRSQHFMRVRSDREIGLTGEYECRDSEFAFNDWGDETSRGYMYLTRINTFNKTYNTYDVYIDPNAPLGTLSHFESIQTGDKVIIPTPGVGHIGSSSFDIGGNNNVSFENIDVYNYAHFGFVVSSNSGRTVFENVNVVPPADETVTFTGWRDGFHCKYNTGALIWENCRMTGMGDDIINISANMMYVSRVINPHEICCYWKLTNGGSYGEVQPGSRVTIYDVNTGLLVGKTTVTEVVDQQTNHYILADDLTRLSTGENVRFYVDSHAAPDSQIINCDFEGTLRFKGAGGIARDSRMRLYALTLYAEPGIEGPIPHDITFTGCDFTGSWEHRIDANAGSPLTGWSEGCYRLENISFNYCKGLTRDSFAQSSNFDPDSPNYLNVTPALGYENGKKRKNIRLGVSNGGNGTASLQMTADFLCDGFSGVLSYNPLKLRYTGNLPGVSEDGEGRLKIAAVGDVTTGSGVLASLPFTTNGFVTGSDFVLSDVTAVPHTENDRITAGFITRLHGDANGDGKISLTDLVRLKKLIAGLPALAEDGADCNSDGTLDAADTVWVVRFLLGIG